MTKVLAKVKDYEITEDILNETIESLRAQQNVNISSDEEKANLLDELIARQLVVEDAIESGLTKTKEFQKLYRDMVFQFSIGELFKTSEVTEEECESFYEENQSQFQQPTVRAAHILVDTEEKANEILTDIQAGLDFQAAATQASSCPSSERGGDLGEFGPGQMVPEFEQAAFALQVGEISGVVKSQFGFHIIKLLDKKGVVPFETAKEQIQQYLNSVRQNELYTKFTEGLKSKFSVEKV